MEWDCVHKLEIRNVEDHQMAVCLCGRLMRWRTTSKASRAAARARRGAMLLARSRLGAVALEFALVFPVFLLLMYGLFEFSRVFWTENTLEFAVEEAARFAIVNGTATNADIIGVATNNAAGLDANDINFSVNRDTIGTQEFVTVDAAYNFDLLFPILPVGPFNLTSSSRLAMVID